MATSAQARPRFSPGFPLHSGGGRDVSSGAHRADQRCLGFPGVSLSPSFAVEGIGVGNRRPTRQGWLNQKRGRRDSWPEGCLGAPVEGR